VDDAYLRLVVARISTMIRETEGNMTPAVAAYGTAEDESLLHELYVDTYPILRNEQVIDQLFDELYLIAS
jgi:hypothetical protein